MGLKVELQASVYNTKTWGKWKKVNLADVKFSSNNLRNRATALPDNSDLTAGETFHNVRRANLACSRFQVGVSFKRATTACSKVNVFMIVSFDSIKKKVK